MNLIIGSRGSDLALYQANLIRSRLSDFGAAAEIKIIKTTGDKIDHLSFDKMEGKSFFTKELEDALLANEIDLAVHSLKDMSTTMPDGLMLGAYCSPEDPSELLLVRPEHHDPSLPLGIRKNTVIGTSSVRRQAQITHLRPDLVIVPLRGNVPTRVRRLIEGKFDAILIARAGVERLQLDTGNLIRIVLSPKDFIPAPGQGILAIQIRQNDQATRETVGKLNDSNAQATAELERGLLARFQGGCQLPLAITSTPRSDGHFLRAFLGVRDGSNWRPPVLYSGSGGNTTMLIDRAYLLLSARSAEADSRRKKVLITRSNDDGESFAQALGESVEVIFYPLLNVEPITTTDEIAPALKSLMSYDWVIFTSKNTVRIFDELLNSEKLKLPESIKIAAVGQKTGEYLKRFGYRVDLVPRQEDSAGLLAEILPTLSRSAKVLLPQGIEAPDTIEDGLNSAGHIVTRINIYTTKPANREALPKIDPSVIDFLVFTSPLSVEFYAKMGHALPVNSWAAAIGRPTAEALTHWFRPPDYVPLTADLADIATIIKEQV